MTSKDGRVLHRNISLSTTMADLADPGYLLVATWLIPHCDDQGRLPADPRRLKAQVFPLIDAITPAIIAGAVQRMATVGLVATYTAADGTPLLQFLTWWKWNGGQRRAYPSTYPAPPGWQDQVRTWKDESAADCRSLPQSAARSRSRSKEQGLGIGLGLGNGAGAGGAAAAGGSTPLTRADIGQAYGDAFGVHGSLDAELLEKALQIYPLVWIRRAILEAVAHKARSWSYAETILERWQQDGGPDVDKGNGDNGGGASRLTAAQQEALARRLAAAAEATDGE